MPFHLHICVTFLQPACHARLGKEEAALNEWPPSPLRLFQAMVAGAAARWAGDDGSTRAALTAEAPVAALSWLESICAATPPTILAPHAVPGQAVPRYVPNNSADLVAARWARGDALALFEDRTKKVFRPTHLLGKPPHTIHYLWRLTGEQQAEARRHERAIAAAARCIVALGWGIDAAVGDARIIDDHASAQLAGERWEPGRIGAPGLRLPITGTLEALIDRHAKFLDRLKDGVFHPVPPLRTFTTVRYRRAIGLPERPFAAFVLRPLDGDAVYASFALSRVACVAAMLRHAACEAASADLDDRAGAWRTKEWSLRFVAGHGPAGSPKRRDRDDAHPRFSYLPLPTIGHPCADGSIRRVIIAEPFGGDGRSARWASLRLAGTMLTDEDRGPVARLEPVRPEEQEFRRVFRLFIGRNEGEARTDWATVTPVILPGYDDRKAAKRERLLKECLKHAGIDPADVECIELRPAAWPTRGGWASSLPLGAFKRPAYLSHLPAWHACVRFREPVRGPIAIGAGRHCGLGLFAAYEQ